MADQSPGPGYQIARTGESVESSLAKADTAIQPGDELTELAASGIAAGKVPEADGAGGFTWQIPAGATVLISTFKNGTLLDGEIIAGFVAPFGGVTLPAGLSSSRAYAKLTATAQAVLNIVKIGTGTIGTLTFAAGNNVGAFVLAANQTIAAGEVVEIVGPASADATLGDIRLTLVGTR